MPGVALLRADRQCRFGWRQRDRVCRQEKEPRILVVGRSRDVSRFCTVMACRVDALCGDYLSWRMQPEIGVQCWRVGIGDADLVRR